MGTEQNRAFVTVLHSVCEKISARTQERCKFIQKSTQAIVANTGNFIVWENTTTKIGKQEENKGKQ